MKEIFRKHRFTEEATRLLGSVVSIVKVYQAKGLRLTLRQLYYQLVTRNIIRNEERQYKRLSGLLSDARLMGLVDWEAIEDRIRQPRRHAQFDGLPDLVEAALHSYRLPRWDGQEYYIELWVEKDALAGVLWPIAHDYHLTLMVNRGYSSQSAMYDAARRFLLACYGPKAVAEALEPLAENHHDVFVLDADLLGKPKALPVLLYLGDHDPSGEDMVRDIRTRMEMFGVVGIDVRKLALTMEQIEEHRPPPNPAKLTDPRSREYVEKHGASSWEVDALPPDVLDQMVRESVHGLLDQKKWDLVVAREEQDKKRLREAVQKIRRKP